MLGQRQQSKSAENHPAATYTEEAYDETSEENEAGPCSVVDQSESMNVTLGAECPARVEPTWSEPVDRPPTATDIPNESLLGDVFTSNLDTVHARSSWPVSGSGSHGCASNKPALVTSDWFHFPDDFENWNTGSVSDQSPSYQDVNHQSQDLNTGKPPIDAFVQTSPSVPLIGDVSRDLIHEIVALYFVKVHCFVPIVHKP
ncbi:hypothetical protein LTR93_011935 [Exophiala xenobiotica]|nr:hypothetical protein LTR93_011935 [Exophiala xenobiotica]